ncbi:MAG: ABC transporter ATP-binding protein [Austwickia sp.]|nr:ABC transporter ATP-binding protein [Austwickia sp.]MBK8437694.1 ABC transporter ATP-binding protein [Austwickia sp.]MBK9100005.1 ABC transporter ATP-binding protein [Austwickia sp.]
MLSRLVWHYLRPYRGFLVALCLAQLLGNIAALYLPSLNADIVNNGVAKGDTAYIWSLSWWMLAASLLNVVCTVAATYAGARAAMGLGRDLRAGVFTNVMDFSAREMARFGAPTLITRTTNDVQQVQTLVTMSAVMLVGAPIMMIGGIVMALKEDAGLAWLVAVAVPVLLLAIIVLVRRLVPLFRQMQTRIDAVNRVMREQISGIRVVRAFVQEDRERARFAQANDALTDTTLAVGNIMAVLFPIVFLVMNVSSVAVIWFGGHRVASGDMQPGSLLAYISYLIQILMSVMMATMVASMIPRAAVAAERIGEVLDTVTSVSPPSTPVKVGDSVGAVELRDVSFTYPGAAEPVLSRISLSTRPGTVTAIIGSTGSGKTTLVKLVPRLFDATDGAVLVDGVDVRDLDPEDLWRRVGLVPQRPYLFSGTVASNLRFGKPEATEEELWAALEVAQARDFVEAMDGGLDAVIAQGGTNVSGGQRQRLCIARALVAQPEIYIFDDAFSALDLATDARLRAALRPRTREATVLIVAQRVSTIRDADQILVLDHGQAVGLGTHAELLASCPTYQEVVSSQLSAEEAA